MNHFFEVIIPCAGSKCMNLNKENHHGNVELRNEIYGACIWGWIWHCVPNPLRRTRCLLTDFNESDVLGYLKVF